MGYVAVKGGSEAIEASLNRLKRQRLEDGVPLDAAAVRGGMKVLIDQVMSEASLYDETTASVAVKQAEGSPEEAVFLLRAFRSTLPRLHYSREIRTEGMWTERRISASFKDIPGGQILGTSPDYSHRLLDFGLLEETGEDVRRFLDEARDVLSSEEGAASGKSGSASPGGGANEVPPVFGATSSPRGAAADLSALPKVVDYLRREGLMAEPLASGEEPKDITQETLTFPTKRAERLQILSRGQTGAVTAFGYAALRGYGAVLHPTVGELRVGLLPVTVPDPYALQGSDEGRGNGGSPTGDFGSGGDDSEDDYYIGEIRVTEVESLIPVPVKRPGGRTEIEFSLGYGICFGRNETKAIAMSLLDFNLADGDREAAVGDEELILLHVDSVEATGFMSHLKLPHYVTFQSKLDSVRKARSGGAGAADGPDGGNAAEAGPQAVGAAAMSGVSFAAPKVGGARAGGFPEGGRA